MRNNIENEQIYIARLKYKTNNSVDLGSMSGSKPAGITGKKDTVYKKDWLILAQIFYSDRRQGANSPGWK